MTTATNELLSSVPDIESMQPIITEERQRIAAILAGSQAVVVTLYGTVAYEPKIAGQGQPFANWARSDLTYGVTVHGEPV